MEILSVFDPALPPNPPGVARDENPGRAPAFV